MLMNIVLHQSESRIQLAIVLFTKKSSHPWITKRAIKGRGSLNFRSHIDRYLVYGRFSKLVSVGQVIRYFF